MQTYSVERVKRAFLKALSSIRDFELNSPTEKGNIVDRSFKSLFEDLMKRFGMKPNEDYVPLSELPDNEVQTDFKVSEKAQALLEGLFEGTIEIVRGHVKKSRNGDLIEVDAYARRVPENRKLKKVREKSL